MYIFDMVHHNPGEPRYQSRFNVPENVRAMGCNGKVYSLFESPVLAVNWNLVRPGTFTGEAEAWRQELFARLKKEYASCKACGLQVMAQSDLLLFPRDLVEEAGMMERFGDISEPWVQEHLKLLIDLVFEQFPELDGLVVRIGETYLHDAPYHVGRIDQKSSANHTIIPLMKLLRDTICVRHDKALIFRTWGVFDENLTGYLCIADAVEPHEKLTIAVKHCEDDFHRGNPFSKLIGFGKHRQLIEIQCSREYEGKGAYPNYLAHGIIDGFEEHRQSRSLRSIGEFARTMPERFAGIWTWSRGGGWEGPYIKNEFWPDLNASILARWCADPAQSEEELFAAVCREKYGFEGERLRKFRRLCLLSEQAVLRGKASLLGYFPPWWTRDEYIGIPAEPPYDHAAMLAEKHEAVAMWQEIVKIAKEFGGYIATSAQYGLAIYRIYEAIWHVVLRADAPEWHAQYEEAWRQLETLAATDPDCATLYRRTIAKRLVGDLPADTLFR